MDSEEQVEDCMTKRSWYGNLYEGRGGVCKKLD